MDAGVPLHTLDAVPRLYALHREEDEDGPAEVIAWGLAFTDGRAFTLWCDPPYPGAFTAFGSLQMVEEYDGRGVLRPQRRRRPGLADRLDPIRLTSSLPARWAR
ncbi:MAG: hypothetical protein ACRDR6_20560 [Pseudonocardiaceae bacterium]